MPKRGDGKAEAAPCVAGWLPIGCQVLGGPQGPTSRQGVPLSWTSHPRVETRSASPLSLPNSQSNLGKGFKYQLC